MFRNKDDVMLSDLTKAYKSYEMSGWNRYKADAGAGGMMLDRIFEGEKPIFLEKMLTVIGDGLTINPDADIACKLFEKLYRDGFNDDVSFKDNLRKCFSKMMPQVSFDRLNEEINIPKNQAMRGVVTATSAWVGEMGLGKWDSLHVGKKNPGK